MTKPLKKKSDRKNASSFVQSVCLWIAFTGMIAFPGLHCGNSNNILLAENGQAKYNIILPDSATTAQQFAASELAKYLESISNAKFTTGARGDGPAIKLVRDQDNKTPDGYKVSISGSDIILSGNSDRAILYAVYDLLEQCGCRWWAPQLSLYDGKAESIPQQSTLSLNLKEKDEKPALERRLIDVDGGKTHNGTNLSIMIDWMAKVRLNTLRVPVNLNRNGRVVWDHWKDTLLPELKKRDMILEVGGHGYQNFINTDMEDGKLFKEHPEWFGKDVNCKPSTWDQAIFNTADTGAMHYFTNNIVSYLDKHPGINIFGVWPPDVGHWADCPEMKKLGEPADRQAALVNTVSSVLQKTKPGVRVELIAYSATLLPPKNPEMDPNVIVDFCPINQSFEKQIFDSTSKNNKEYVDALRQWRKSFNGNLGVYTYYRKYAWRSQPNVFPHYIQKDIQWYASLPLQGISTYAEPGDWYTYELNHYVLALTAWNPQANIDEVCTEFFKSRYGSSWETAQKAYATLEAISPVYGSIPFTSLKSADSLAQARQRVEKDLSAINNEAQKQGDPVIKGNFSRLVLMLQYLQKDLQIQELKAKNTPEDQVLEQIHQLVDFMVTNISKGVFVLTGRDDFGRFTKKYGITNQSLLD